MTLTTSFSWNIIDNTSNFIPDDPLAASPTLPDTSVAASFDTSSLHYYVRFELSDGTVVVGETQDTVGGLTTGLFALEGFSFSDQNTSTIGSATGGAGAGKATFNPLHLSFTQLGLESELLKLLATGAHLTKVDVLGFDASDNNQLAVDYTFGVDLVQNLTTDQSGSSAALEFATQKIQTFSPGDPSAPTLPDNGISPSLDTSSLHYYVQFELDDGSMVSVDGNQLFALDGFSFGDQNTTTIGSGTSGAGAGKVTFNPLHLNFNQLGLDPELLRLLASGAHLNQVDVLGYDANNNNQLAVDYSFRLDVVTNLMIDQSGSSADLEVGEQRIQTFSPSDPSAPTLPDTGVAGSFDPSSLHYYARFELSDGTVVAGETEDQVGVTTGLFALDGFSFSDQNTSTIGSATGGAGAGKATFNPLHLNFTQLGLQSELFKLLATGAHLTKVDVLGFDASDNNQLAIDYAFGVDLVQSLTTDQSGSSAALESGEQRIQTFSPGDPLSPTLPDSGISTRLDTSSLHYYVQFELDDGSMVSVDGNQLFALEGFSFDDQNTTTIGSGTSGAGAGKLTFNPLHLNFTQLGLDPELFRLLATGAHLNQVDVLGYDANNNNQLAVDYTFGLDLVQNLTIDQSGSSAALEFAEQKIQTFSPGDQSAPTLPDRGVAARFNTSSLHYYVRFELSDGPVVVGETQDLVGGGLFALDGFSFSDQNTSTIGSATGGAGAGKATFNPLHLSFTQFELDPELFKLLATGAHFSKVDVLGYDANSNQLAIDYTFSTDFVKSLTIDPSGSSADLEFGAQKIQTFGPNAAMPPSLPTTGVTPDFLTSSMHYYVQIELNDGSMVSVDGNQLFEINDFSFGEENPSTIGSATGGAGTGKVSFNLLHVSLKQLRFDPEFFKLLATGDLLKQVDVLGYNTNGNNSHLAIDYSFGLASVEKLNIDQTVVTQVDVAFGAENIDFTNQPPIAVDDGNGVLVGASVLGNVLANDSDPDGDGLTVSAVDGFAGNIGEPLAGSYGHLTLRADGSYSYVADNAAAIAAGPTGSHLHDLFSYTAYDGLGGLANANLDIMLDRLPIATNDAGSALAGGSASGNVLTNDSDPDGDSLTVSAVGGLAGNVGLSLAGVYGHLLLSSDGSFSYAADNALAIAAGPTGSHLHDIFSYTANDGLGGTGTAKLDITLDRRPVVVNDASSALAGGAASGDVLTNDSDPDGDPLIVSAVAGLAGNVGLSIAGAYGHLLLNADGTFSYAADNLAAIAAGPTGSHLHDIFSYTANDGLGGTANAKLDVTLDRPPVAINDLVGVVVGKSISGSVLVNDSDPDGDAMKVIGVLGGILGQPGVPGKFGTLVLSSDGTFTYTSNKNAVLPAIGVAQDSFVYTESDGHGGFAQATLNVTIVPNGMNFVSGTPGQTLSTGNGKTIINGSLGGQTIIAGNGADTIIGGPLDVLTGGNGPDTFVFGPASGRNTIADFDVHNDVIDFDHSLFGSVADILGAAKPVGSDTIITYHDTDTLTLQHVTASTLRANNFALV